MDSSSNLAIGGGAAAIGVSSGTLTLVTFATWGVEVIRGRGKVSQVSTVSFESISTGTSLSTGFGLFFRFQKVQNLNSDFSLDMLMSDFIASK